MTCIDERVGVDCLVPRSRCEQAHHIVRCSFDPDPKVGVIRSIRVISTAQLCHF